MNIWLITVGEPLPGLSGNSRPWRTGILARELVRRGHVVTWWTSRVDHFRKEYFATGERTFEVEAGLVVRFLEGRLYRRNISIGRLVNHWQIARDFAAQVDSLPLPDIILCSFPTIELSSAAIRYGARHGIPVVLDVRDLWPDIFLQPAPRLLRGVLRVLLHGYFSATEMALAGADGIVAISPAYQQWALARARRPLGENDRIFPLAYSLPGRTPSERLAGRALLLRYGVGQGNIACVFAGTLGRTYDLAPVFAAAARCRAEGSPMRFIVCGDGERAPQWRDMARGLDNVSFTGWLGQAEMRAALMGADLGLAAYANGAPQGLPNKVIEYLAAGLPVVSSLGGETQQLLRESQCGLSYAAGDGDSLHAVLVQLENAEVRDRMASRARRKFEAEFEAETVYPQLAEYLEAMAARRRPLPLLVAK